MTTLATFFLFIYLLVLEYLPCAWWEGSEWMTQLLIPKASWFSWHFKPVTHSVYTLEQKGVWSWFLGHLLSTTCWGKLCDEAVQVRSEPTAVELIKILLVQGRKPISDRCNLFGILRRTGGPNCLLFTTEVLLGTGFVFRLILHTPAAVTNARGLHFFRERPWPWVID